MNTTISNSEISATFNSLGAELISLQLLETKKEYIWEGDAFFWGKHSPVLFPIVGTLKNNCYYYNDKKYELLRHGFARTSDFELIQQSNTHVVYSLKSSNEIKKVFPFDFELQISYVLTGATITIGYTVINNDEVAIPFSIGGHPAFALPQNFENYTLQFTEQETLECFKLEHDLVSNHSFEIKLLNKQLPLQYEMFRGDALIFKKTQSKEITILENNKSLLKVSFHDFKNLGIWTKLNAPFICIEPWMGYSDTNFSSGNIFEKEGIQLLEKDKSYKCAFSIEIL